ncbi:MAG: hypothetical protein V4549_18005 [Bacteroidota bacterium]
MNYDNWKLETPHDGELSFEYSERIKDIPYLKKVKGTMENIT